MQDPKPTHKRRKKTGKDRGRITKEVAKFCQERDKGICQHCASGSGGLQLHHRRYRSRGGTGDAINLITLCSACHAKVHANHQDFAKFRTAAHQEEGQTEEELK